MAFFASALYSELAPMRDIANEALTNVLGMHFIATKQHRSQLAGQVQPTDTASIGAASPGASVTKSGVMLDVAVMESEEDWLSTVFYDYLYSGWQDEAEPVVTYYSKLPEQRRTTRCTARHHPSTRPYRHTASYANRSVTRGRQRSCPPPSPPTCPPSSTLSCITIRRSRRRSRAARHPRSPALVTP